jgi:predicted nuclease of predicted toxin-antitoxin system
MKFFLDHDVPAEVGRVLASDGHEVVKVAEAMPITSADHEVFREASARNAILITCNRDDFLSLAETTPHKGLVVLIRRKNRMAECGALLRLIGQAGSQGMDGNINYA